MTVKNISTGKTYETTPTEWQNVIVAKGLAYKYEVVDNGTPIEIRSLREHRKLPVDLPIEEVAVKGKTKK